ncbi:translation initiation factor IF-2 [Phycisphaerales bacterium AB-hyl4]|uniref:Translation initiation factor IF-2 n=1 Tax=Natronomicrosphaera hydrolytica TaxID=3242702 RepID=A0ABV4U0T9_9BACT
MAKAKRVFELAKELSVSSKAIVEKCKAEGVPGITNHMSTVKLGLAQTIREWFGEAESGTAIETAEKVDLKKARKPARRRRADADGGDQAEPSDTATATVDRPAQTDGDVDEQTDAAAAAVPQPNDQPSAPAAAAPTQEAPAAPVEEHAPQQPAAPAEPSAEQEPPAVAAEQSQPEAPDAPAAPEAPQAPVAGDETPAAAPPPGVAALGRPNVPDRPKIIAPAGQQLQKPKQATLKGPNVVRIEKPEPVRRPRQRRGPGAPGGPGGPEGGGGEFTPAGAVEGITRSRGPTRGGGVKGGGGGEPDAGQQRGKRRQQRNVRRGRSADALPTGPTKFSQADMEELDARLKGAPGFLKQRRRDMRKREQGHIAPRLAETGGKVEIAEPITIKSLSSATGIKTADIIKYLFKQGVMATINSAIDTEAAMEVALEYDIELEVREQQTAIDKLKEAFDKRERIDVRPRPPVATVLGHVDHGKTSLLDRIRKEDVAAHEAGGITQHIGAYRVTIEGSEGAEKTVVFLDTPGHEAFTSMRARGANMTDLVVLVVAADDGVMPQTIESINHAKAAGVPIIVALNKIDVPQATSDNIQKIYGQLAEHGLNPVEWGGETEVIKTSAEKGTGVTDLLEVLDYQAELLELTADFGGPAAGRVIEAEMQPGRGSVARVLVQSGQIKVGDFIVIGRAYGRVRDMTDDHGRQVLEAGPATPLEISGIDDLPDAGDGFYITTTLQAAEQAASQFREVERHQQLASKTKVTLDNFADQLKAGKTRELRVVLKADVQGSADVLRESLEKLGNNEVTVRVIHSAVGGITESDVLLADASEAIVIGFHVIATPTVREIAEEREVDIRLHRVIYDVTEEVTKALEGMLEPERKEEAVGSAEVREVFRISKVGAIAGCVVAEGSIQKSAKARIIRDGIVVTDERNLESLRRVKDDVREVRAGTECGIKLAGFDDVKIGDTIQCYNVIEIKRKLV